MDASGILDLVIIGAGWHGLAMAKTYIQINPSQSMLIVDSGCSIGGSWAAERLYPGLKTNNVVGSFEFSDFPMAPGRFGLSPGEHIPGEVVHKYLCEFVEEFNLSPHLQLRCRVVSAELQHDGSWILDMINATNHAETRQLNKVRSRRLVIATGLTSEPSLPRFDGQGSFEGEIMHARDMKHEVVFDKSGKSVTVIGGNKSAWDTVYSAAKSGVQVHWIIRSSGHGPSFMIPAKIRGLGRSLLELCNTRAFNWFDPCIWGSADGHNWIRYFLHKTLLGRLLVSGFWAFLGWQVLQSNRYGRSKQTAKLQPWYDFFWLSNSLGIWNYELDFLDLIANAQVEVHVSEIDHLKGDSIQLSNGSSFLVSTIICCTGWKSSPPLEFMPASLSLRLGLPRTGAAPNEDIQRADEFVLAELPSLRSGPSRCPPSIIEPAFHHSNDKEESQRPYQLHRYMVPTDEDLLSQRNIAFIGVHQAYNTVLVAQVQALWITAYFGRRVDNLESHNIDVERTMQDAILQSQFSLWRHPPATGGAGRKHPDILFGSLPYMDMLLRDLGLESQRKKGNWINRVMSPYRPVDYRGLVQEWVVLQDLSCRR